MMRIFGFWVNHEPALNQNMATKGMSLFFSMYAEHGRVDRKKVTMLDKPGDVTKITTISRSTVLKVGKDAN